MADKKESAGVVEKVYTVPLRSTWKAARRIEKTKKSVKAVKEYVAKHTRTSDVSISEKLNTLLWKGGAKKPLHTVKIKVHVSEGKASAMLPEEISFDEEKRKFLEKERKKAEKKAEEQVKPEDDKAAPAPEEAPKAEEKKEESEPVPEKAEEKK